MRIQQQIINKITEGLSFVHLEVVNESHGHAVAPGSETHFKVVVVSAEFDGLAAIARHRKIYQLLAEELRTGVHALALHTFTPVQWQENTQALQSPACLGGSMPSP